MKLATQEPTIRARFPRLHCNAKVGPTSQEYGYGRYGQGQVYLGRMHGEDLTLTLRQDNTTIAEASWSTNFPHSTKLITHFIGAEVSLVDDLMTTLLLRREFTQADLAVLSKSSLPDVRAAAARFVCPGQTSVCPKGSMCYQTSLGFVCAPIGSQVCPRQMSLICPKGHYCQDTVQGFVCR